MQVNEREACKPFFSRRSAGPATGLPTRTGQGDLLFVIHASQDEFPRFVFAPRSLNQAYDTMLRAFHLCEKYQVPAVILTDQYFNDSLWMTNREMEVPKEIERFITSDADMSSPSDYKRFKVTESGISPRALPCKGRALVGVTANEHGESDVLVVGWGSSDGAIREAVDQLRSDNFDIGALHFSDLWPFPRKKAADALSGCKHFITVEQNASSQLGLLIRQQTGLSFYKALLKYDGRPFTPDWIVKHATSVLEDII